MVLLLGSIEYQISDIFQYVENSQRLLRDDKRTLRPRKKFLPYLPTQARDRANQARKSTQLRVCEFEELKVFLPSTTDPIKLQKRKRSERDEIFTYLSDLDQSFEPIQS